MHTRESSAPAAPGERHASRLPSLRNTIRKSALLNLTIILTSFPVLIFKGGPQAIVPCLAIMLGISIVIWSVTFALFSFVSIFSLFCTPAAQGKPTRPAHLQAEAGVSDRWLDGSI